MSSYTAPPIPVAPFRSARRAQLVFSGVELAGPSFEARVFLNNPAADESTDQTSEAGYAGSFHVYGYGEPPPPTIADARTKQVEGGGPVAPIEKQVLANEEAFRAAVDGSDNLTVTVVTLPVDPSGAVPKRPFGHVDIVVDPAATAP